MLENNEVYADYKSARGDTKTFAVKCKLSPNLKQELADAHHELQSGMHSLERILKLLEKGYHLKPQNKTDYLESFNTALNQVLPSLEVVNQLYHQVRLKVYCITHPDPEAPK